MYKTQILIFGFNKYLQAILDRSIKSWLKIHTNAKAGAPNNTISSFHYICQSNYRIFVFIIVHQVIFKIIPLRRMSEAILLGVHLRFSYSLLGSHPWVRRLLVYLDGGWGPTFRFLKSAQNRAASTLWVSGHCYKSISCATKLLWVYSNLKSESKRGVVDEGEPFAKLKVKGAS